MRTNRKALWATVFVCTIPAYGQADNSLVRLNLKDASRNGPPDTLPVYVEVATVQPDVEQGIVITLNIQNNGSQTIRILDPVDTFGVFLHSLSLHGPASLRNTTPDFVACRMRRRNEQQLKSYYDDKEARRPFQPYDSEEALRDQRMKTVSDIVPWDPTIKIVPRKTPLPESERFEAKVGGKLTLEPGERFQAVVRITRVIADGKGYKEAVARWRNNLPPDAMNDLAALARPQPQIVDITPGTYLLAVSSLVSTDADAASWVTSSDRVTIQLGEPSGADEHNGGKKP